MVLRTETFEKLEEDISDIFDAVPEYFKEKLMNFNKRCSPTDEDALNEMIDEFIDTEASYEDIDRIQIYHLSVCSASLELLLPLDVALTENGCLQNVLAKNHIEFKHRGTHLDTYYENVIIPEKFIKSKSPLLARRLGLLGTPDYCINGFSFLADIKNDSDGYHDLLKDGPEILQNLDALLGTNVAEQYRKKFEYYALLFEVPMKQAIFDRFSENISSKEKAKIIVRNSLKKLLGYYLGVSYSGCNIHVRIPDGDRVKIVKKFPMQ